MAEVDHGHVSDLLNIIEKCAGHTGKLSFIANEAMSQLLTLNEQIRVDAVKAKEAAEAKAAAAVAKAKPKAVPSIKPPKDEDEDDTGDTKPKSFPSDSATDTIADRRI